MATYTVPAFNPNVCTKAEATLISMARSGASTAKSNAYNKLFDLYYLKKGEIPSGDKGYFNKCAFKVASAINYDFEWVRLQKEAQAEKNPTRRRALQEDADQHLYSDAITGFANAVNSYDFMSMPFKIWLSRHINWALNGVKRALSIRGMHDTEISGASTDKGNAISLARCKKSSRKVIDENGNKSKEECTYFKTIDIDNGQKETSSAILAECLEKVLSYAKNKNPDMAEQFRATFNAYEVDESDEFAAFLYKERQKKSSYSKQALGKKRGHFRERMGADIKKFVTTALYEAEQDTSYGTKTSYENID